MQQRTVLNPAPRALSFQLLGQTKSSPHSPKKKGAPRPREHEVVVTQTGPRQLPTERSKGCRRLALGQAQLGAGHVTLGLSFLIRNMEGVKSSFPCSLWALSFLTALRCQKQHSRKPHADFPRWKLIQSSVLQSINYRPICFRNIKGTFINCPL